MNQSDLTPGIFIKRMQTRKAVHRWLIPVVVCALISFVPIVLENTQAADTSGQLAQERMIQAQSRVETSQSLIKSKSALLSQKTRELQAGQHLTLRPDWSGVLTLVSQQFNDQLMMTGYQLGDASDNRVRGALGAIADDTPKESVWLILNGVAAANSDVPGLIMRLEQLGLFERVVMTGSQREVFAGDSRTTFTLACKVQ